MRLQCLGECRPAPVRWSQFVISVFHLRFLRWVEGTQWGRRSRSHPDMWRFQREGSPSPKSPEASSLRDKAGSERGRVQGCNIKVLQDRTNEKHKRTKNGNAHSRPCPTCSACSTARLPCPGEPWYWRRRWNCWTCWFRLCSWCSSFCRWKMPLGLF